MKAYRDFDSEIYSEEARILGTGITMVNGKEKYFFEFKIKGFEAEIKGDRISLFNEAIDEFRKYYGYINVFYNKERTFYKAFDEVFTYPLPISCIQPSFIFINQERLNLLSRYLEEKEVYLPVTILNDEYVLLDGHTRLYAKLLEDKKMVHVYMSNNVPANTDDLVYMAKEANVHNIKQMELLSKEEYDKIIAQLNEMFNQQ